MEPCNFHDFDTWCIDAYNRALSKRWLQYCLISKSREDFGNGHRASGLSSNAGFVLCIRIGTGNGDVGVFGQGKQGNIWPGVGDVCWKTKSKQGFIMRATKGKFCYQVYYIFEAQVCSCTIWRRLSEFLSTKEYMARLHEAQAWPLL